MFLPVVFAITEWEAILSSYFMMKLQSAWSAQQKTKGQLNSEWIYEVIVSPKVPTKNFKDFWPGSLLL